MLDFIKLKNKVAMYEDMIQQFNFQISNLEFEAFGSNSQDKVKENNEKIKNYKKTIRMYQDLIQKLETRLENEYTEYII
jgi:hypothetical protein